jgi:hypothetical protein
MRISRRDPVAPPDRNHIWEDEADMETAFAVAAPKLAPLVQADRIGRLAGQSYAAEPSAMARSTS